MKLIFDFIVSIPQDKLLHIWAGMVIALVTMRILSITPVSGWFARLVTLIAVIIAGGCREWYNKRHGGKFDFKDWYATNGGGLIVIVLAVY